MKSRPEIGLDCDGILSDFFSPCLGLLKDLFNIEVKHEELASWDLSQIVPIEPDLNQLFWDRCCLPNFALDMKPFPEAIEAVQQLQEIADVYIVTAVFRGNKTWVHERELWLEQHFGIPRKNLISTKAKHMFGGDALVEDQIDNLHKWKIRNPTGKAFLYDRSYNRNQDLPEGLVVVRDWGPILSWAKSFQD